MTLDRKDASIKDNYNELSKPNICQKKKIYSNNISKYYSKQTSFSGYLHGSNL